MSKFCIVFLDGEKKEVESFNFSTAMVQAAYDRMTKEDACMHKQLSVNEKASSEATKELRRT